MLPLGCVVIFKYIFFLKGLHKAARFRSLTGSHQTPCALKPSGQDELGDRRCGPGLVAMVTFGQNVPSLWPKTRGMDLEPTCAGREQKGSPSAGLGRKWLPALLASPTSTPPPHQEGLSLVLRCRVIFWPLFTSRTEAQAGLDAGEPGHLPSSHFLSSELWRAPGSREKHSCWEP